MFKSLGVSPATRVTLSEAANHPSLHHFWETAFYLILPWSLNSRGSLFHPHMLGKLTDSPKMSQETGVWAGFSSQHLRIIWWLPCSTFFLFFYHSAVFPTCSTWDVAIVLPSWVGNKQLDLECVQHMECPNCSLLMCLSRVLLNWNCQGGSNASRSWTLHLSWLLVACRYTGGASYKKSNFQVLLKNKPRKTKPLHSHTARICRP